MNFSIILLSVCKLNSFKLGTKIVDRSLSLADSNFVDDVIDDLTCFLAEKDTNRVLVFPPVSNYRRFLIHQCVDDLCRTDVKTFSIGVNDERRTVVCFTAKLLSDVASSTAPRMGLTQTDNGHCNRTDGDGAGRGERDLSTHSIEIRSAPSKPRRPDRAVYVPRALRSIDTHSPNDLRKRHTEPPYKCSKERSLPSTPKRSQSRAFTNIYTPPPLRHQKCDNPSDSQVPNNSEIINNSVIDTSGNENFYIGDYFANGQLGFYVTPYYNTIDDNDHRITEDLYETNIGDSIDNSNEVIDMADTTTSIINDYSLGYSKDEDVEHNELRRASQEINRGSKRIIKQTFDSDVLVISDPIEEPKKIEVIPEVVKEKEEEKVIVKPKLEAKVSLKREDNDWDTVFDDSGECLDPTLLEELSATVGKVQITKAKNSYEKYQTKGQSLFNGPYDETLAHVVEVYDFPSEFKTNDLLSVFSEYKDTGFEIKWVDDTHALIVFSSAKIAAEVLSSEHTLVRCRPLHAATLESRNKAKKCAEFLQPYRQRPETCTALARRLVSGALGVKLSTAREERDEERRLISRAREKKRQAALHKEAAWDGSLTSEPL